MRRCKLVVLLLIFVVFECTSVIGDFGFHIQGGLGHFLSYFHFGDREDYPFGFLQVFRGKSFHGWGFYLILYGFRIGFCWSEVSLAARGMVIRDVISVEIFEGYGLGAFFQLETILMG